MRKIKFLIPIVLLAFAFQDGRDREINKIWDSQIRYLQGEEFIRNGITGQGIRIAVLDGGFPGVNTSKAFRHLVEGNKIAATWNFVRDRENVYTGVSHGTAVLACIAGIMDGRPMGLAPDAEFLLAVTEQRGEPLKEELNWAKAVDWAIDNGADIIQSSLGYTYQRYFTHDLDGRKSIAAQAAARAARKGVLIINCGGNEGQSKWQTLVTPADSDSILSVGAIDPETGLVAAFSSVGPTADKRLKPNVCAPGKVVTANARQGTRIMHGTSFSAPLITGFAACTWQLNPSLPAQEIIALIEKSGHLYPYYDYSHGYGIPQASRIIDKAAGASTAMILVSADSLNITVQLSRPDSIRPQVSPQSYLYYHISKPNGHIKRYGVYRIDGDEPVVISRDGFNPEDFFRFNFNGQTETWNETR
jgi:serine protease AprX